ncbi:hypothetical protein JM658_06300 [Joostella atrarenae]|uniref:Uncharacterized protein n=1 Tax=Joostella atrarenae TaxID=679257 RepID=A0ABS9J1Z2_9FLAO|nr:hypothetical protein [Joostella atrarenae]MCF8714439.1 hypothetical protein [Joostella atrarenae]
MKNSTIFFLILLLSGGFLYSQEHHSEEHSKEPGFETALTGVYFYTPESGNVDFGSELFITYWISHKWAFGGAYTMVFEEEGRIGHELTAVVSHKPWPFLTLNAGPSFSMPNSHLDTKVSLSLEGEYNYFFGDTGWHTGPVLGAQIGEDFKIIMGLQLGYEF